MPYLRCTGGWGPQRAFANHSVQGSRDLQILDGPRFKASESRASCPLVCGYRAPALLTGEGSPWRKGLLWLPQLLGNLLRELGLCSDQEGSAFWSFWNKGFPEQTHENICLPIPVPDFCSHPPAPHGCFCSQCRPRLCQEPTSHLCGKHSSSLSGNTPQLKTCPQLYNLELALVCWR